MRAPILFCGSLLLSIVACGLFSVAPAQVVIEEKIVQPPLPPPTIGPWALWDIERAPAGDASVGRLIRRPELEWPGPKVGPWAGPFPVPQDGPVNDRTPDGLIDTMTTQSVDTSDKFKAQIAAAKSLTADGLCERLLRYLFSRDDQCHSGVFQEYSNIYINVARQENPIIVFTAHIIGKSESLVLKHKGFESHSVFIVICTDFDSVPQLLIYNYRPEYNAGSFDNIADAKNPNTGYIEKKNDDVLDIFQDRIRSAVVEELISLEVAK
ncbi:hypothetical protein A6U96_25405 [Agrobacterium tumefaciens]|nr:hypothetical protein A6U96_25405 [Agrobacterium tumefaciens]